MQIHHITLLTGDISSSIAFYTQILGFRFVKNSVNQENPTRRHVYFADYPGSPGTVTTFIEVPHLGTRYDEACYIQGIDYYAPIKSKQFWQEHLEKNDVPAELVDEALQFSDPHGVPIRLFFVAEEHTAKTAVSDSPVPKEFQILRLKNTNFYVSDPIEEEDFFFKLTGIRSQNHQLPLEHGQSITFLKSETFGTKRFGRGSIDHIALTAHDKNEVAKIRDVGNAQKFQFEKEIDRKYFYSVYFKDKYNNRVEFATMGPGFTADEDLKYLGEKLGLPDNLEPLRDELLSFYETEGVTFTE